MAKLIAGIGLLVLILSPPAVVIHGVYTGDMLEAFLGAPMLLALVVGYIAKEDDYQ